MSRVTVESRGGEEAVAPDARGTGVLFIREEHITSYRAREARMVLQVECSSLARIPER
jgi:hypothetical protein